MHSDHRFNRDEISKILKRAAELEHQHDVDDDSEGLTVQELQEVSKEVGLHPKYIQLAIDEVEKPEPSAIGSLLGGPFTYRNTVSAEGLVSDDEWEELVSEIRRIHGGIGRTSKLGKTFEWEQRKKEIGYIQVSLTPRKTHTKININANYRYFATMAYIMTGIIGMMFYIILFDETNIATATQIASLLLGVPALFAGVRFYLSRWMKKKQRTYKRLFNRFQEILGVKSSPQSREKAASPAVELPPEVEEEQDATRSTERQRHNIGN